MQDTKEILEKIVPIYDYEYDQVKVGKILYTLITNMNYNRNRLAEAAKKDEREFHQTVDIHALSHIAQTWYQEPLKMAPEKVAKKQMDGIGTIGVMYHGEPEVTLTLAILGIRTHNNMVFFVDEMREVNHVLIRIIQDTIQECGYTNSIYEVEGFKEEFTSYQSYFDLGIFVGEKQEYQRIKEKLRTPVIYNGYGNVLIYADDVQFKEVLMEMDQYVYDHNIHLQYFHQKEIKEDIQKMNEIQINDCVAIFTKDFKKAYEFISKVKAKKVYVNTNPFSQYQFSFDEKELIIEKQIMIKE